MEWNCVECHMKFQTLSLYEKHKRKFCLVGRKSETVDERIDNKKPAGQSIPEHRGNLTPVSQPLKNGFNPKNLSENEDKSPHLHEDWRERAARDVEQKLHLARLKQSPLLVDASNRKDHARSARVLNNNQSYENKLKEIEIIHNNNSKDLKERNRKLQEEKAWIMEQMAIAKLADDKNERIPSPSVLERKEKELEEMKRRLDELENQRKFDPLYADEEVDSPQPDIGMTHHMHVTEPVMSPERTFTDKATETLDYRMDQETRRESKPDQKQETGVPRFDNHAATSSKSNRSSDSEPKASSQLGLDPLDPSPYDPRAGFGIFWDYVLGLDISCTKCCLTMALYMGSQAMTDTKPLPLSDCFLLPLPHYTAALSGKASKIGLRTPFPRCLPNQGMYVIVELKVNNIGSSNPTEMATIGWTKIDLFDFKNRVISGRWKVPVRILPIQPELSQRELNKVDQVGHAEIYFRIVNTRDVSNEEQFPVQPQNSYLYKYLQEGYAKLLDGQTPLSFHHVPTVSLTDSDLHKISSMRPEDSQVHLIEQEELQTSYSEVSLRSPVPGEEDFIGFQVDKVSDAGDFEGIIKLSLVSPDGQVLQSSDAQPVSFSTPSSKPSFLTGISTFGLDEHEYKGVKWNTKSVVLVELMKVVAASSSRSSRTRASGSVPNTPINNTLVAWTTLPLADLPRPFSTENSLQASRVQSAVSGVDPMLNTGFHDMPLFQPPKVELNKVPLNKDVYPPSWQKLNDATVTIFIYDNSLYSAIQPSPAAKYTKEDVSPEGAFIENQQSAGSSTVYEQGDGFDLYIDGARFLPDCVAISKVVGGILDRKFKRFGNDIETFGKLDSMSRFPDYDYSAEYREPTLSPSSTLYLKVYVADTMSKNLSPLGVAALPIFLETGTLTQPQSDNSQSQVSLNEGAHQIRLYYGSPSRDDALSVQAFQKLRPFPCASLLVRIVRAPNHPNGRPKERSQFTQSEWHREGLLVPKPQYSSGVYYSSSCIPKLGECQMFHEIQRKQPIMIRDAVKLVSDTNDNLSNDVAITNYIKAKLTKSPDVLVLDFNTNLLVQYNPYHGLKVSVDRAQNLPWSGFTVASYCFLPPAAYFKGNRIDAMNFVYILDFESQQKNPEWKDRIKHYPMRTYSPLLMIVFQLHEFIFNEVEKKLKLNRQAWCVIQLFMAEYCLNGGYQLPLYDGTPPMDVLEEMQHDMAQNVLLKKRRSGEITLLDRSSVFIRICDARREDELKPPKESVKSVTLPNERRNSYIEVTSSLPLASLLPHGISADQMTRLIRKALEETTRSSLKEFKVGKTSVHSLQPPQSPGRGSLSRGSPGGRPGTNPIDY